MLKCEPKAVCFHSFNLGTLTPLSVEGLATATDVYKRQVLYLPKMRNTNNYSINYGIKSFHMKKITIAIDGFSSCGKSTMAKDLARQDPQAARILFFQRFGPLAEQLPLERQAQLQPR